MSATSYATDSLFTLFRSELNLVFPTNHVIEYGGHGPVQWSASAVANLYQLLMMAVLLAIPAEHFEKVALACEAEQRQIPSRPQSVAAMLRGQMPEELVGATVAQIQEFLRRSPPTDDPSDCS